MKWGDASMSGFGDILKRFKINSYSVKVSLSWTEHIFFVRAESEEEAKEIVKNLDNKERGEYLRKWKNASFKVHQLQSSKGAHKITKFNKNRPRR